MGRYSIFQEDMSAEDVARGKQNNSNMARIERVEAAMLTLQDIVDSIADRLGSIELSVKPTRKGAK